MFAIVSTHEFFPGFMVLNRESFGPSNMVTFHGPFDGSFKEALATGNINEGMFKVFKSADEAAPVLVKAKAQLLDLDGTESKAFLVEL